MKCNSEIPVCSKPECPKCGAWPSEPLPTGQGKLAAVWVLDLPSQKHETSNIPDI